MKVNESKANLRIKELRKKAGLNQEQMADKVGMKRSTYAHAEAHNTFKYEYLKRIAVFFNRTVDELENGDNIFTRAVIEKGIDNNSINKLREEPDTIFIKTDTGIDLSYISANEIEIIKCYRQATSENRTLILDLVKKLGTM